MKLKLTWQDALFLGVIGVLVVVLGWSVYSILISL